MLARLRCHLFGCHDPDNSPYVLVCCRCGVAEHIDEFSGDFVYQGWISRIQEKIRAAGVCLRRAKCQTCGKRMGRLRILWRHIVQSQIKWHCNQECLDNDLPF